MPADAPSETPVYTCGLGLSKNVPGAWRYTHGHARRHHHRHTTPHHTPSFLMHFANCRCFLKKNLRPRAGGQFRLQITVEWVNKKRPQTDLYFNKIWIFCSMQHPTTPHRGGKGGRGGDWGRRGETGTMGVCVGRRRGRGGGTGGGRRGGVERRG